MPHLYGPLRCQHERAPGVLVRPDMLALLVVALVTGRQGLEQIRIGTVRRARGRHELVWRLLVATVLGKDHDRAIKARVFEHVLNRDGIGDAAVQVLVAPDLYRLCHQGQRGGSAHGVDVQLRVANRQVLRRAEENVGNRGVEPHGVDVVRFGVKGIEPILNVVQQEVVADHAPGGYVRLRADVARIVAEG